MIRQLPKITSFPLRVFGDLRGEIIRDNLCKYSLSGHSSTERRPMAKNVSTLDKNSSTMDYFGNVWAYFGACLDTFRTTKTHKIRTHAPKTHFFRKNNDSMNLCVLCGSKKTQNKPILKPGKIALSDLFLKTKDDRQWAVHAKNKPIQTQSGNAGVPPAYTTSKSLCPLWQRIGGQQKMTPKPMGKSPEKLTNEPNFSIRKIAVSRCEKRTQASGLKKRAQTKPICQNTAARHCKIDNKPEKSRIVSKKSCPDIVDKDNT